MLYHGINIGHGYVKYVAIDEAGRELPPVVFPALIAPAEGTVLGALDAALVSTVRGQGYWTGEDALISGHPRSMLTQERLTDAVFLPALVKGALARLGATCAEALAGVAVTGLPATWAEDRDKLQALAARLRDGAAYTDLRAIPEPVGAMHSVLLDADGAETGDPSIAGGRWLACDWGHRTDDEVVVDRRRPVRSSLRTYDTGTAAALERIGQHLAVAFDRDFTAYEVDQAVREGGVRVFGELKPLPMGWDRPLIEQGDVVARRMENQYKRERLDGVLLFGGGAAERRKVEPVLARFPHAVVAEEPQLAIARGYARTARRFGLMPR